MKCRQCAEAIEPGQRFCRTCGCAVEKRCTACDAPAPPDARFCGACGHAFAAKASPAALLPKTAPTPAASRTRVPLPIHDGERRQITVLFADLVGSTALSTQLDPEALRDLLRSYQHICSEAVTRFGGNVRQFLGDGVLAYFGHPQAHENDAERAVLAGLALIAALNRLASKSGAAALQARVGIHTGVVVVGEMGAGGAHVDLAVGQTPNIAARVQGEAAPNTVCISAATQALVSERFEARSLGLRELKGLARPEEIFVVAAARIAQPEQRTALVGRDAELERLVERWGVARLGKGQVVYLSGEGGIGKSRLLGAFHERIAGQGRWLSVACSPFSQNSALQPIIDAMADAARMEAATSASAESAEAAAAFPADAETTEITSVRVLRRHVVQRLLSRAGLEDDASAALVASLLGLTASHDTGVTDLAPAQRKRRVHEALIAWLLTDSQHGAMVLVVEDLHWVDASTRELLGTIIERITELPVLLLLTFRPEFVPPWPLGSQISSVALGRLAREQVVAIASAFTGLNALPPGLIDEIVRRTDGVPLFVEEITKAIVSSGAVVERDGAFRLAGAPDVALELPATLRDSLTARLDRLGNAKAVAQLASVLGREFDHGLLQAVSEFSADELETQLAALNLANIIQQFGAAPRARYIFKHALIQEAAYDSLLKSARQTHHRRVAMTYVAHFPELIEARPELAAHHFSRAAMPAAAVPYWRRAGELAVERGGHEEAIAHLDSALEQIASMPDSAARAAQELAVRVAIGPSLFAGRGMASTEAGGNYARACELAAKEVAASGAQSSEGFMAMWGDWLFKNSKGQLISASQRSEDLVTAGRKLGDDGFVLQAHHSRWTNFFYLGNAAVARADTLEGIRLYDPERHRQHKHLYGGHDPGVCARCFGAVSAWATGHASEGVALARSAMTMAGELDHSFTLATAYLWSPLLFWGVRDHVAAQAASRQLMTICDRYGFAQWMGAGQVVTGLCMVDQGDSAEGLKLVDEGLSSQLKRGAVGFSPMLATFAAQAHLLSGNNAHARELLAQAVDIAEKAHVGWYVPETLRQLALSQLRADEIGEEEAMARLAAAAALAREQGAAVLQWRAASDYANLAARRGQLAEAVAVLQVACGEASGGVDAPLLDAPELVEARAMLEDLQQLSGRS